MKLVSYRIVAIMQKPKQTLGQRLIESLEKRRNQIKSIRVCLF